MTAAYVWTVIAAIAVAFGVANVIEAVKDERASKRLNGSALHRGRRVLAKSCRTGEMFRMATQMIFLLIGAGVLIRSDPRADVVARMTPDERAAVGRFLSALDKTAPLFQFVLTWGLVLAAAFVMANSIRQFFLRRRLEEILAEDDAVRAKEPQQVEGSETWTP